MSNYVYFTDEDEYYLEHGLLKNAGKWIRNTAKKITTNAKKKAVSFSNAVYNLTPEGRSKQEAKEADRDYNGSIAWHNAQKTKEIRKKSAMAAVDRQAAAVEEAKLRKAERTNEVGQEKRYKYAEKALNTQATLSLNRDFSASRQKHGGYSTRQEAQDSWNIYQQKRDTAVERYRHQYPKTKLSYDEIAKKLGYIN